MWSGGRRASVALSLLLVSCSGVEKTPEVSGAAPTSVSTPPTSVSTPPTASAGAIGPLLPGRGASNLDQAGLLGVPWGTRDEEFDPQIETRLGRGDDGDYLSCPDSVDWLARVWKHNDAISSGTLMVISAGGQLAGWELTGSFPGLEAEPIAPGMTFAQARSILGNDYTETDVVAVAPPVFIPAVVWGPSNSFPFTDVVVMAILNGSLNDDAEVVAVRTFGAFAPDRSSIPACVSFSPLE